ATANWVATQDCGDGTEAEILVTVLGGREVESDAGEEIFATVLLRGRDCEGQLVNDRGSGTGTYTGSPSLMDAHLTATIETRGERLVSVDVTWEGTGGLETTINQTQFPGFVGIFTSKLREATATGTVVVDGVTLVSGPAFSAEIETLEDRNTSLPSGSFD
ncbi:MAG TPA: hypothetical protein VHF91_01040, partial [Acidimicrobiales bacterium]|nr:hypothetical protein [Acidimicrobiales bacterium]